MEIFLQKNGQIFFALLQGTEKNSISPFFLTQDCQMEPRNLLTKFVRKTHTPEKFLPQKWAALPPFFHRWSEMDKISP